MYIDIIKKISQIAEDEYVKNPELKFIKNNISINFLDKEDINFYKFIKGYVEQWSISSEDYEIFKLLNISNKRVLEIGRLFGLSTLSFLDFNPKDIISIDDYCFGNVRFENFNDCISTKKLRILKALEAEYIRLDVDYIKRISDKVTNDQNVKCIYEKFDKHHLDKYKPDIIFEDICNDDKSRFFYLDDCINYYYNNKNKILIIHDDLRFPEIHEYIKGMKDCYTSDDLFNIFGVRPNMAIFVNNIKSLKDKYENFQK
jgi:hypothetical protein